MRWMLAGDWPVGQWCIPTGTVLTGVARDGKLVEPPTWNGITLPMPMPLNAIALDEDAALMMLKWFDQDLWYRLHFDWSLDRDAIMARALGRWPHGRPASGPQTTSAPPPPPEEALISERMTHAQGEDEAPTTSPPQAKAPGEGIEGEAQTDFGCRRLDLTSANALEKETPRLVPAATTTGVSLSGNQGSQ